MAPAVELKPVRPEEAIRLFRQKGYKVGFSWRDVWHEEHALAFTVAKATSLDVLAEIRNAVDRALSQGLTFRQFKAELEPRLRQAGWWGAQPMFDPATGKTQLAQLGSPRRLRTIYDANLRSAHARGRWERIERLKARRPYLRYSAVLDSRTRPQHQTWHGTVLPVDDPWWDTHSPPNGWHCRCVLRQLSERDLPRNGWTVSDRPAVRRRAFRNDRRGETVMVPEGIDPGWGYNVGKARFRPVSPAPGGAPPPLPQTLQGGQALPPLPDPLPFPAEQILPAGLGDEAYARAFLAPFGADLGKGVVFEDVTGFPLPISEELLRDQQGRWKLGKGDRARHLVLLADTIRRPDEIWMRWERRARDSGGRRAWSLRRYYVAVRAIGDGQESAVTVFGLDGDRWFGASTFVLDAHRREDALQHRRGGLLMYRRTD